MLDFFCDGIRKLCQYLGSHRSPLFSEENSFNDASANFPLRRVGGIERINKDIGVNAFHGAPPFLYMRGSPGLLPFQGGACRCPYILSLQPNAASLLKLPSLCSPSPCRRVDRPCCGNS